MYRNVSSTKSNNHQQVTVNERSTKERENGNGNRVRTTGMGNRNAQQRTTTNVGMGEWCEQQWEQIGHNNVLDRMRGRHPCAYRRRVPIPMHHSHIAVPVPMKSTPQQNGPSSTIYVHRIYLLPNVPGSGTTFQKMFQNSRHA